MALGMTGTVHTQAAKPQLGRTPRSGQLGQSSSVAGMVCYRGPCVSTGGARVVAGGGGRRIPPHLVLAWSTRRGRRAEMQPGPSDDLFVLTDGPCQI